MVQMTEQLELAQRSQQTMQEAMQAQRAQHDAHQSLSYLDATQAHRREPEPISATAPAIPGTRTAASSVAVLRTDAGEHGRPGNHELCSTSVERAILTNASEAGGRQGSNHGSTRDSRAAEEPVPV